MESAKTTSDLIAPVTGKVLTINEVLKNEPTKVNKSPLKAGWIAEISLDQPKDAGTNLYLSFLEELLDEDGYDKYCEEINK